MKYLLLLLISSTAFANHFKFHYLDHVRVVDNYPHWTKESRFYGCDKVPAFLVVGINKENGLIILENTETAMCPGHASVSAKFLELVK